MEFKTADVPAYKLSKAMLNAYTKIVAEQLARDYPNIIVKAVDPGWYTFDFLFSCALDMLSLKNWLHYCRIKTDMGGPGASKYESITKFVFPLSFIN
jgi:NAD(P)-dependent dehydrogenase (short-subunit alcohol dehydrogenase family)